MLWRTIPKEIPEPENLLHPAVARGRDPQWVRQMMGIPFVGVAIFNARTKRWVRFNDRFCTMVGYTRAELMRLSWREVCHPDDAEKSGKAFSRIGARHGQHERIRQRLVRKDGSILYAEIDASDVKTSSSADKFVVALVTESQTRIEPADDSRYKLLWNACSVAVVLIDTETWQVVDANPAALNFYELPLEGIRRLGLRIWSATSHEAAFLKARLRQVTKGEVTHFEAVHRRADGLAQDLEVYCGPAEMESQHVIYGVVHDITKRVAAERALAASEQRFRAVLEQPIAAVFVVQDDKVVYANPHMREIFGYSCDEPFNSDPLGHIAKPDWPKVRMLLEQRSKGVNRELAYSVHALRKDGTEFTLGVHSAQTVYQNRPAVFAIARDITEKARAEQEALRHVAALQRAMQSTIEAVSIIGEMRDPYTHGHERRVGELAAAIGNEMELDAGRVEGIRIAGYLHDIGKISVPAELLAKPTKLTEAEFALVREHSRRSYDILKGLAFPWPVAQVALQHHERLDGSGYPQGLKGDAIILESRIMAVADVVEAMSSHRPYRPGLGIEKALAEIERGRGIAYDPAAVDCCLRLFRDKGYVLPD